jgi:predicted alpha/beta hydrolase family esterase
VRYAIVPGIGDSDAAHWQSIWQVAWGSAACRIRVGSWSAPDHEDWREAVGRAVAGAQGEPVVLVAHSLGCLAAASWATTAGPWAADRVRGMFLVAPPDPSGASFPPSASTFVVEPARVPVPALVVASDNDPYATSEASERMARGWGVRWLSVGAHGHLNSASGLGEWVTGQHLLLAFEAGLRRPADAS